MPSKNAEEWIGLNALLTIKNTKDVQLSDQLFVYFFILYLILK